MSVGTAEVAILPRALNLPPTRLLSNFFTPKFTPGLEIRIYSLHFTPDLAADNRLRRKQVISTSRKQLTEVIGGHVLSGGNLFAVGGNSDGCVVSCGEFTLRLQLVRTVPVGMEQEQPVVQLVLNVLLKRAMRELGLVQLTTLPRFYKSDPVSIPSFGLQVWRGYSAELIRRDNSFYVNIDFSSKITHTKSLLDVFTEIRDNSRDTEWEAALRYQMKDRIVITNYGNRKCYRITDICMDKTPLDTFEYQGSQVTFLAYFQTQYNLTITKKRQPLVRCIVRKPLGEVYLVPELVSLTGLDDSMRADYRLMSAIAEHTRLEPQQRLSTSTELPEKCARSSSVQQLFSDFSFSLSPDPVEVQAYQLPRVHVTASTEVPVNADGNFNLRENKVFKAGEIRRWVVMAYDMKGGKQLANGLYQRLQAVDSTVPLPEVLSYHRDAFQSLTAQSNPPTIVVILLPKRMKSDYAVIKRNSVLINPVLTQVVMGPVNDRRFGSILDKLTLQIQAKIGGLLWTIGAPAGFGKYVMVVGLDVYHDTVDRKKSAVGFCATINSRLCEYYSATTLQTSGQEIALTIGNLFAEALKAFHSRTNGRYPESIIFYRDGVSESQDECVRRMEVDSVLRTCKGIDPSYSPQVIYTLVVKRIGTRFFSSHQKISNPAPGTLVTELADPGSFYLIAHAAKQGVAAPTLYRTVYSTRPVDVKSLISLTYGLCHMYYNWTGAIKVPAPCMLAHKLANLVGQSLHSEQIREEMKTHAFYL